MGLPHARKIYIDLDTIKPKDLSYTDLASLSNVDRQSIVRMKETNKQKRYPIKVLNRLCTFLKCHVADVIRFEGHEHKYKHPVQKINNNEEYRIENELLQLISQNQGLTVQRLAKELDRPYESVRKFAHNKMERIPKDMIEDVCAYFDIEVSQLFSMQVVKKTMEEETEHPALKAPRLYEIYTELDELLKENNMTMADVANGAKVPYLYVFQLTHNQLTAINVKNLEAISDFLKVSPGKIVKFRKISSS